MINTVSNERQKYLKNKKRKSHLVLITQVGILIVFLALWEFLAQKEIIDSFITSSPSRILNVFINFSENELLKHIGVTVYETVVGFLIGTGLGIIIAIILWWSNFLARVAEPYLVVLNSLPKVALRTSYNNLGRCRHTCNNSYGSSYIISCNNFRELKWVLKNRSGSNKNGKNI